MLIERPVSFHHRTTKKKWTREDTERFIEAVEKYPVLYDCKRKDYKNQVVQATARAAIAKDFNCST